MISMLSKSTYCAVNTPDNFTKAEKANLIGGSAEITSSFWKAAMENWMVQLWLINSE